MHGMPHWSEQPRYRRAADAPRIEVPLWVRVLARRVEGQLGRDWSFGYASWNYIFRPRINLSRTVHSYEGRCKDRGSSMTAQELEDGAVSL